MLRKSSIALVLMSALFIQAEEPERKGPTAMEIYEANYQGGILYREERYEEAYPLLLLAAQHGLKPAQARVGSMHLHGLGEAEKDPRLIIGWLGVASSGKTDKAFKKVFNEAWDQVPEAQRPNYEKLIDVFAKRYGSQAHGVKCKNVRHFSGQAGMQFSCEFTDDRYGKVEAYDPGGTVDGGIGGSGIGGLGGP